MRLVALLTSYVAMPTKHVEKLDKQVENPKLPSTVLSVQNRPAPRPTSSYPTLLSC